MTSIYALEDDVPNFHDMMMEQRPTTDTFNGDSCGEGFVSDPSDPFIIIYR